MKYIKQYDNFKPIKVNSAKPFKVKKNIDKSIQFLQRGIKSLRKRLDDSKNKNVNKHAKMNNDKNDKIQKLKDLQYQKLKQQEYLRNSVTESNEENEKNLLTFLESDFDPKDIQNYIGIDENDYQVKSDRWQSEDEIYKSDSLTIFMKSDELENLMNINDGVINWMLNITNYYSNYEYYIDDSELDYLDRYLSYENIKKIEALAKLLKYELKYDKYGDIDIGVIHEFFIKLGLKRELTDFKNEISSEKEQALKASIKDELKTIPFEISYSNKEKFDIELYFDYEDIIKYIKKHNLQEIKSISEFLENVQNSFSYDIEYEGLEDYIKNGYKDLNREVENVVEKYLDSPDDIFPKLIQVDNLELFKNNIEYALFSYWYKIYIKYNDKEGNLFELAKIINGDILKWLKTSEFEKYILKNGTKNDLEAYEKFIFEENIEKYGI